MNFVKLAFLREIESLQGVVSEGYPVGEKLEIVSPSKNKKKGIDLVEYFP